MRRQCQGPTGVDCLDHRRSAAWPAPFVFVSDLVSLPASSGVTEVVSDLLHAGADVNAVNEKGQTAL